MRASNPALTWAYGAFDKIIETSHSRGWPLPLLRRVGKDTTSSLFQSTSMVQWLQLVPSRWNLPRNNCKTGYYAGTVL